MKKDQTLKNIRTLLSPEAHCARSRDGLMFGLLRQEAFLNRCVSESNLTCSRIFGSLRYGVFRLLDVPESATLHLDGRAYLPMEERRRRG